MGHDTPFTVGAFANISCSFDMDLTTVQWLYNGNVVATSTSHHVQLLFNPVNDTIHGREYRCRAMTPFGVQERSILIRVQGIL